MDRLCVVQNGFANAASRRAFFAKLGAHKKGFDRGSSQAKRNFDRLASDVPGKYHRGTGPSELSAAADQMTARAREEGTEKTHREAAEAHRIVQEFAGSRGWPSRGLSFHLLEHHKEKELEHTREADSIREVRSSGMVWLKRAPIPAPA